MTALGIIGIVIAVAFLIYATMKNYEPVYTLIVVALVLAVTNGLNFEGAWLTTLMEGSTSVFVGMLPIFVTGMLFAAFFAVSGASKRVATSLLNFFTRIFKPKPGREQDAGIWITICSTCAISFYFGFFGINGMVTIITLFPLVTQMMKKYNLNRKLMPILLMSNTCLVPIPFSTNFQNVTSAEALGLTTGAGMIPGFVAVVVVVALNFILMHHFLKKESQICGWVDMPSDPEISEDAKLPSFIFSIIPVIAVFVLYQVFKLKLPTCFVISIILELILYFPQLKDAAARKNVRLIELLRVEANNGVEKAMYICVTVAILTGYSEIIINTNAFQSIVSYMTRGSGAGLYIMCTIAMLIIVFISCNPVSGFFANLNQITPYFLQAGLPAAALHRLNMICTTVFDSLPTATGVITSVKLCGCSMKDSYKYLFVTTVVTPLIGTCIMMLMFIAFPFA